MGKDNIAKISIIGGDSIEVIGGSHTEYVGKMTYSSNQKLLVTAVNGKSFGDNPEDPPKTKGRIIDIVMFVAGTTDPINTDGKKHQANTDYWRSSKSNFWHKVKELKSQFLDVHIEGDFFSWSGDNDTKERKKASERLLDLLLRVYPGWKNQEVHLHLIGHSHGGNVINQFTELIANKEMIVGSRILKPRKITEFPKLWKVKSITYLSTPFFQKKHQLNHAKLHKQCKIINVHNEYDLTQRLVADFSLVNLEVFLKNFQMEKFQKGLNTLKSVNSSAFKVLYRPYIEDEKEGPLLWKETAKSLAGINQLTHEFIIYIKSINLNKPSLGKERDSFVHILNKFQQWTYETYNIFNKNSFKRKGGYGRSEFVHDLNLSNAVGTLNELFNIKTGVKDSYILSLLAKIFAAESGVTDSIEITSWSPKKQVKSLSILDVNITKYDSYDTRGKKSLSEKFINATTKALQNNNLEEVLMRIFSQFVSPFVMIIVNAAFHVVELFIKGNLDAEVKKLRKNIKRYSALIEEYNCNLVAENDKKNIADIMKRPGTIPYLSMVSHSLSHTKFWKEVEDGLKSSFSSEKNPKKYKK